MRLFSKKSELLALYALTQPELSSRLLSRLTPNHFMFPATKAAFQRFLTILRLKGESMDWISLTEDPALDLSQREFLQSLDLSSLPALDPDALFRSLEAYRTGRSVNDMVEYAKDRLKKAFDPEKLIDDLADRLLSARVTSEDQKLYHIGLGNNTTAIVKDILDQSKRPKFIPTGFPTFDQQMGGFPDQGVVVLAATTSSGKSTMANQLALNMHRIGWDVCKVSLEMSESQEIERILSNQTGIPHHKFQKKTLSPTEINLVKRAYKEYVEKSKEEGRRLTIISPTEDLTFTQLLMLVKPFNYKVIYIDYITLLAESGNKEQWKQLSDICREAKRYTLKNDCLIVMLAQLDDDNKIRYSRAVKEHSDVCWMWNVQDSDRDAGKFTVNQTKGRNQGLMSFDVGVKFDCFQIFDLGDGMPESGEPEDMSVLSDISDLMG